MDVLFSILTSAFKVFQIILFVLLAIVIAEIVFCVITALKFRVETLSKFRERFLTYYAITTERNTVSWEESKHNWFLWLSVFVGNINTCYLPMQSYQGASETDVVALEDTVRILGLNAVCVLHNTGRYAVKVLLVPFYLIFSVCSFFERLFRFVLDPMVYGCFWALAKLKIFLIYHLQGKTIIVDSVKEDTVCTIDVIYRKPVIRIVLSNPSDCPDSLQKDNINHFTTTLKSFLPAQNYIAFKTEVVYPGEESVLQAELPLTISYLRATYAKLNHIKS